MTHTLFVLHEIPTRKHLCKLGKSLHKQEFHAGVVLPTSSETTDFSSMVPTDKWHTASRKNRFLSYTTQEIHVEGVEIQIKRWMWARETFLSLFGKR